MRKATFIKTDAGNYRPVNQRAHALTPRAVDKQTVKGYAGNGLGIYLWAGDQHSVLRKVA
jgi:hypothetical protein